MLYNCLYLAAYSNHVGALKAIERNLGVGREDAVGVDFEDWVGDGDLKGG